MSQEDSHKGKLLRKLVKQEEKISEELLYDLLKDYVQITDRGEILLTGAAGKLETKRKILIVLIAKKALKILGMTQDEKMSPKEIEQILGVKGGTVRSTLAALKEDGYVYSPKRGIWAVNWARIGEIKERLIG